MRLSPRFYLLALTLCFALPLVSQSSVNVASTVVPRLIRFSGVLKSPDARPLTSAQSLTFTLHKSQEGGAALWIETQNVHPDETGKYTVLLGATKPDGIPTELFTSGEAQWLSVRVDGEPEQPRVLLVSVPYALKAAEADTLAGHAATDFVTTDKLTTAVQQQMQQSHFNTASAKKNSINSVLTSTATNFTDSTSSQVVGVTQTGTGKALVATAGTNTAIYGNTTATSGSAVGVYGQSASTGGVGIYGYASSASGSPVALFGSTPAVAGIAIAANETATTGTTTGLQTTVYSSSGVAAVIQNKGGGKILSGRSGSSETEVFSVAGNGNVNTTGSYMLDGLTFDSGSSTTQNAFLGFAGSPAVTGTQNVGVGYTALAVDTTGFWNTATGYSAGSSNTTGSYNTAIGALALRATNTASNDTAVGYNALVTNTKGAGDTAVGSSALLYNTNGNNNTALGNSALNTNTVGDSNTAVGYLADVHANNLTNATAIGARSYVGQSNTIVLGSIKGTNTAGSDAKVGIGTTTPVSAFHVLSPTTTPSSVVNLDDALGAECGTSGCTAVNAVSTGTDGFGVYAYVNAADGVALIATATGAAADAAQFYGDVTVYDGCLIAGGTTLAGSCASDQRLKTNIHPIAINLDKLAKLHPVHFNWRPDNPTGYHFDLNQVATGLIAQQVEALFPDMVSIDKNGYRRIDYGQLPFMLLAGLGELKARNDRLAAQVRKQEDEIRTERAEMKTQQAAMLAEIANLTAQVRLIQATLKTSTPEVHVANAQRP